MKTLHLLLTSYLEKGKILGSNPTLTIYFLFNSLLCHCLLIFIWRQTIGLTLHMLLTLYWKGENHITRLQDIPSLDFSTPSFNPELLNPRLFNQELFNPRFMVEQDWRYSDTKLDELNQLWNVSKNQPKSPKNLQGPLANICISFVAFRIPRTINLDSKTFKSSWLKSLGLKVGLEKFGVAMSFNHP